VAEECFIADERPGEFVVFDQAMRLEHSTKEKTIEQLLAGVGEFGE
jgi:hypothetical protein